MQLGHVFITRVGMRVDRNLDLGFIWNPDIIGLIKHFDGNRDRNLSVYSVSRVALSIALHDEPGKEAQQSPILLP